MCVEVWAECVLLACVGWLASGCWRCWGLEGRVDTRRAFETGPTGVRGLSTVARVGGIRSRTDGPEGVRSVGPKRGTDGKFAKSGSATWVQGLWVRYRRIFA